jgi:hypothetical protein
MVALRYDVTVTAATQSPPLVMNRWQTPFNASVAVISSTGNQWGVQHTFDNPFASDFATGATWFNHASLATLTGSEDGNYAFPVTAIRITATGAFATDAGNFVRLIVNQAG